MVTLRNKDEGQLTCLMGHRLDMEKANKWDISWRGDLSKKMPDLYDNVLCTFFFSEMKTFCIGEKSLKMQDIKG